MARLTPAHHNKNVEGVDAGAFALPKRCGGRSGSSLRMTEFCHAASVFSTSLIQYEVPYTIASSLKL
jgi:hypothetical protein